MKRAAIASLVHARTGSSWDFPFRRLRRLFGGEGVNAAFGLAAAGPPPGAFVLAFGHGPRARPAADALIAAVQQVVIGNAFAEHVGPGVLARPVSQWIHLDIRPAVVVIVAFENVGVGAHHALVAPQAGDPRVESRNGAPVRLDFAYGAALIRIGFVKIWSVPPLLLLDGQQRP